MTDLTATLSFADALRDASHWWIVLLTLSLIGIVVTVHYEVLARMNSWLPKSRLPSRSKVLALIIGILIAHAIEIWIFGIGIHVGDDIPGAGRIVGAEPLLMLDAVYLSAMTFTTVGYGDLIPHGPIRLILGAEALTGFVLITWSASFTYLEMARFWRRTQ